jgi:hypothetical protein
MPGAKHAKQALENSNKILDRAFTTDSQSFQKLDPFFCHGRAGVLQIALRRHQLLQSPETKRILRKCLPLLKLSKKKLFSFQESARIRPLLEGYVGYGLVLISLLEKDDLAWDRIFLMTTPNG